MIHFSTQKRLNVSWLSNSTLSAFINALAQASSIDPAEIQSRNDALNIQLHNRNLSVVDAVGDDNCFFKVSSVSLHWHQRCHLAFRATIAHHVDEQTNLSASSEDCRILHRLVTYICADGTWASEFVICAITNAHSRLIREYFTVNNHSPLKYLSVCTQVEIQSPL